MKFSLIVRRGIFIAGAVTTLIGAYWMVAWFAGWAGRWSAAGALIPKTNMALCQLFGGIAFILAHNASNRTSRAIIVLFAFFVSIIGGLTFIEHIFNYDLGIDQLLMQEAPGAKATAVDQCLNRN